jgi:transcription elongation factor Elf1
VAAEGRTDGARMTCADCDNIESYPVKLHNGTAVCGSCEAWRHECEARAIMRLGGTQERRTWLDDIERRRGQPARLALQQTIGALWPIQ